MVKRECCCCFLVSCSCGINLLWLAEQQHHFARSHCLSRSTWIKIKILYEHRFFFDISSHLMCWASVWVYFPFSLSHFSLVFCVVVEHIYGSFWCNDCILHGFDYGFISSSSSLFYVCHWCLFQKAMKKKDSF